MSIQESKRLVLRPRIEELSSEILLQKELLKKLEHDKILVKRELNAVADPVARLPLELSSEIFLQSLDPLPKPQPRARHAPMLLLILAVPVRGSGKAFRRFLKRSAAPIQQLVIGTGSHVRSSVLHSVDALYSVLVDSPSLLPNLRRLDICVSTNHPISLASWRALVSVVTTRRVEFHVSNVHAQPLPQDVFTAFMALIKDGIVEMGADNEEPQAIFTAHKNVIPTGNCNIEEEQALEDEVTSRRADPIK
ncbi:hypothetical protein DFH08DRAFT_1084414 [Mycena albidolilacea]|uniref:Uncharacterized protein n=1 Tax=Mycena albidolilacea TaxID=1033008 RepID=A0AAD6ZM86_9AGAR|nr:hypothetical protein DFH08DRAFT_1084414 [Mycena albidolilacea]